MQQEYLHGFRSDVVRNCFRGYGLSTRKWRWKVVLVTHYEFSISSFDVLDDRPPVQAMRSEVERLARQPL